MQCRRLLRRRHAARATLAHLATRGEEPFASATLPRRRRSTLQQAGDLLLFTDADQLEALNELMPERGYLDGSRMANVFNMLRSNDLIWRYIVNNYLLGKKPFPFDLLSGTRLDADARGQPHLLSAQVLWREPPRQQGDDARQRAARSRQGQDCRSTSSPPGRTTSRRRNRSIAGAAAVRRPGQVRDGRLRPHRRRVNPPGKIKYQYWTNAKPEKSLEEWVETAEEHPGSWWPHWAEWLAKRSGDWIEPREPGKTLGVIEDAPGSYVKAKV